MIRFFGGVIVGGLLAFIIWWPLGVMYAVEAVEPTTFMKMLGTLKGMFG